MLKRDVFCLSVLALALSCNGAEAGKKGKKNDATPTTEQPQPQTTPAATAQQATTPEAVAITQDSNAEAIALSDVLLPAASSSPAASHSPTAVLRVEAPQRGLISRTIGAIFSDPRTDVVYDISNNKANITSTEFMNKLTKVLGGMQETLSTETIETDKERLPHLILISEWLKNQDEIPVNIVLLKSCISMVQTTKLGLRTKTDKKAGELLSEFLKRLESLYMYNKEQHDKLNTVQGGLVATLKKLGIEPEQEAYPNPELKNKNEIAPLPWNDRQLFGTLNQINETKVGEQKKLQVTVALASVVATTAAATTVEQK